MELELAVVEAESELKSSFSDFELFVDELDEVLISFCLNPFGFHNGSCLLSACAPAFVLFGLNISSAAIN